MAYNIADGFLQFQQEGFKYNKKPFCHTVKSPPPILLQKIHETVVLNVTKPNNLAEKVFTIKGGEYFKWWVLITLLGCLQVVVYVRRLGLAFVVLFHTHKNMFEHDQIFVYIMIGHD